MEPTITSEVVVAYSQCPRKAYLLMFSPDKGEPHEYVKILEQERLENQRQYTDRLKQKSDDVQPYTADNLRKGHDVFINAHLQADGFEASCSALTKVDVKSALGKHSYEPTLCMGTHTISKEQKLEVAFVGHVLERLQNKQPIAGKIVGMSGSSHSVKLENASKDLLPIIEPIKEWIATDVPEEPPIILNKHCSICPFQQSCQVKAEREDNLSLLGGIKPKEILKFNNKGIFTINQLSYTFRPRRIRKRPTNYMRPHSFELQSLAIKNKNIYVHELPILPKSKIEIYFDIEGIPDLNFQYLIGVVIKEGEKTENYSLWSNNNEDEISIFNRFLDIINSYQEFILFHYGSYEYKYLQRMYKKASNTDRESVEKALKSCCNILSFLYSNIYLPVYTNGLKDVGKLVGFSWTDENASGLQSIVWRKHWEKTQSESLKDKLIIYNKEDCYALMEVKNLIYSIVENHKENNNQSGQYEIIFPENIKRNSIFSFQDKNYSIPEMELINNYSFFDYERERVHVRKQAPERKDKSKKTKTDKEVLKIDETITIFAETCNKCKSNQIAKTNRQLSKSIADLDFFNFGVKRIITEYITYKYQCSICNNIFIPEKYNEKPKRYFGHGVKCWVIFQNIVNKESFEQIIYNLYEIFNIKISSRSVQNFKSYISQNYRTTYDKLLKKVIDSHVVYIDETPFNLVRGTVYAWILTNGEEVVSIYRPTREGDFLKELLKDFKGVLVSDFFQAYDSLDCAQQKCLIHIIRDMNDDLLKNPFDEEFKNITRGFTILVQNIIYTIDKYGLKKNYLSAHRKDADKFLDDVTNTDYKSEIAKRYQERFEKNKEKLFTFLNYDDVLWNNTYAEHAIKILAVHRNKNINYFRSSRMDEYLRIMSLYQTCEYKEISFLRFLLSGETDIDKFEVRKY